MKTVCIIQARLGSTRLPSKVLRPILGRPMLSYMIERVRRIERLDEILIATTELDSDQPIVDFCRKEKISVFRGNEKDVLDRYYQAAKFIRAEVVVRLTSDCPLIDPAVVDQILDTFYQHCPEIDFVGNVKPATFPDGMDTEIFSFNALERSWKETKNPLEREHVTPYFYDEPGRFRALNVEAKEDLSRYRVTVDYPEDFEIVTELIQALYKQNHAFSYEEMVDYLESHPQILRKNAKYQRNPWYAAYRAGRGEGV